MKLNKVIFGFLFFNALTPAMQNNGLKYQCELKINKRSHRSFDAIRKEILDLSRDKIRYFYESPDKQTLYVYFIEMATRVELKESFKEKEWFHRKNLTVVPILTAKTCASEIRS